MGIPMTQFSNFNMQFHGLIPGKKAKSLGQIALDVVFGEKKNFRKERLTFEMSRPKGVITITGNQKVNEECLQKGSQIADEKMAMAELDEYNKAVDSSELLQSKKPTVESAFQSA
ncbi:uncharacterized protein [Aegilops tauschii subsp. strangulata]|uniref:uncharacterized protein n=1 Tax=Aegilops tauschii subsp. strangulata TaxID=200361 RepID=UPI00098B1A37|nr:uncharacterized protein LOC109744148 [Aegilops tauschii subsp. strangulata]